MGKQVASPARQEEQTRLDRLEADARRQHQSDEAQKQAAPGPDEGVGTEAAAPEGARELGRTVRPEDQKRLSQQERDQAAHAHAVIPEHARHRPDAGPHLYELQTTGAIIDGVKRAKGYRARLTPAIAKAFQSAGIGLTRVEE